MKLISQIFAKNTFDSHKLLIFVTVTLGIFSVTAIAEQAHYDLILRNGTIVDGSGSPAFTGDVGVTDGRITAIGDLSSAEANTNLNVDGLVVAPGFIDSHSHAEEGLIEPGLKTNKGFVTQGVTTSVFGVDGGHSLQTINEIRSKFVRQGVGTNYMFYVGHNGIRQQIMGMAERAPTSAELLLMKDILVDGMQQGMLGLSSGLMYLPGRYADRDELIELAKAMQPYDGMYDSHIRDPANHLIESIAECLEIGELAGVQPHPAHIKAVSKQNFGSSTQIINLINKFRAKGMAVTADLYPYDGAAARNLIAVLIPPANSRIKQLQAQLANEKLTEQQWQSKKQELTKAWQAALLNPEMRRQIQQSTEQPEAGMFSWVNAVGYSSLRVVVSNNPLYEGRMVVDIAQEEAIEPFDVIANMIVAEGSRPKITLGAIEEEDVRNLIKQTWVMISSDGNLKGLEGDSGHPRFRGTFPRVLGRYVREWGVLTLPDAVRKMTSLPASYLKLNDRGLLAEGYWADITVFDPDKVLDQATWEQPALFSTGIVHVVINGEFALRDGAMTDTTHGKFLPYMSRTRL